MINLEDEDEAIWDRAAALKTAARCAIPGELAAKTLTRAVIFMEFVNDVKRDTEAERSIRMSARDAEHERSMGGDNAD